ncbi:sulfur carrier protein ThiS [Oikeobacillus pervagus]|nr:sulfur carrier protein ThiS [Oikeobacillus pervagus]
MINGNEMTFSSEIQTIEDVITHLQLKKEFSIVEVNQTILQKGDHAKTPIADGDRIEIVHFVGGG